MPHAARSLLILASALALAGCFAQPPAGGEGTAPIWTPGPATVRPDFDFSAAIEFEHDHADPAVHALDYGMRLVGHTAMTEAARPGSEPGGFNEVSVGNGIAVVANYGPHRVFSVVDVSDPTAPKHLADWWASDFTRPERAGASSAWGLTMFPEADLVVVSLQVMANPPLPGSEDQIGGGLFLVNIEDPTAPREESFTPVSDPDALIPVGVHTVRVFDADGQRYVAASTANGITIIYRVEGEPGARTLAEVSRVKGMHDTTVQVHPITGQRIIYGAEGGVYLTDITDPAAPEVISFIPSGEGGLQAYHQVVPNDVLIDGRHYIVSATENTEGLPTPFTFIDTTDPAEPVVVSQWRLPLEIPGGETSGNAYRYTGHNVDFDHGRLYIGHSHAGVWVLDLTSTENVREPFPVAFYQPHADEIPVKFNPFAPADVPSVWSAYRHTDGLVYAPDCNTGLYILEVTEAPSPYEGAPVWPHNVR